MVQNDLLLYRPLEWRIASLFRCIGPQRPYERGIIEWNQLVGKRGRARFKLHSYTGREGNKMYTDELVRFYDWDNTIADYGKGVRFD